MRIHRIFSDQPLPLGEVMSLDTRAGHHLGRVLRVRPGQRIRVFNGDGHEYEAIVVEADGNRVSVHIEEHFEPDVEPALSVQLGQAVAKGNRMDQALEKAVELGVAAIQPLWTERTEVKLDARRLARKLEHWRGVVIGACEQSGRVRVPIVAEPRRLVDWCGNPELPDTRLALAPEGECRLRELPPPRNALALAIGPEGGFSDSELERLDAAGFTRVGLGPRVLRTETAGSAALAAIQTLWGDLG